MKRKAHKRVTCIRPGHYVAGTATIWDRDRVLRGMKGFQPSAEPWEVSYNTVLGTPNKRRFKTLKDAKAFVRS